MPGRLRVATLHRVTAAPVLVAVKGFARVGLINRVVRTVPQGGIPSDFLVSSYSSREWAKYSRANLNRRLIDVATKKHKTHRSAETSPVFVRCHGKRYLCFVLFVAINGERRACSLRRGACAEV